MKTIRDKIDNITIDEKRYKEREEKREKRKQKPKKIRRRDMKIIK